MPFIMRFWGLLSAVCVMTELAATDYSQPTIDTANYCFFKPSSAMLVNTL
jgi:hypothetical protein